MKFIKDILGSKQKLAVAAGVIVVIVVIALIAGVDVPGNVVE